MSKEKEKAASEAASEAEAAAEKARLAAEDKILVRMHKDGQFLKVHPTTVKGHMDAGWMVAAAD